MLRALFLAALASYAANCSLGAAVATRRVSTAGASWVHHALYSTTCILSLAAVSSLVWSRSRAGLALLPAAIPLAAIPRVSARTAIHPRIALAAAPFFVASAAIAVTD